MLSPFRAVSAFKVSPAPRRVLWLGAAGLAVLAAFALWRFAAPGGAKTAGPKSVPVTEAVAAAKAVPITVSAIGHAQPVASVALRARIDGQIAKVTVTDGQVVKAGDVLFLLDDRQARAALDQATAALAHDQAQLDYANKEMARQQHLARNDFASREQLDLSKSTAAGLEAQLASDRAQIESAQTALSFTTIAAPIDGRIGSIAAKEGNIVSAANTAPLATINQMAPIYVAFSLPQSQFPDLRTALDAGPVTVEAVADGDKDHPIQGTVSFIENAVDPATGTIGVKAVFANADEKLWPGQFVDLEVVLRVEPHAVTVPSIAVQNGQAGFYAFVIRNDQTVELRAVTPGATVGGETIVEDGVRAGEHVVTTGQLRLVPGAKVKVVKETPAKDGTAGT